MRDTMKNTKAVHKHVMTFINGPSSHLLVLRSKFSHARFPPFNSLQVRQSLRLSDSQYRAARSRTWWWACAVNDSL